MYEGFALTPNAIKIPPKGKLQLTEEDWGEYMAQAQKIRDLRGHFIENVVFIEAKMNIFIERSMVTKNAKMKNIFRLKFINEMTFQAKIELTETIMNDIGIMTQPEQEKLVNALNFIKTERNRWAHSPISFEQKRKNKKRVFEPTLHYINSIGEIKPLIISDRYIKKLNQVMNIEIFPRLEKLMKKVKFK